MIVISVWYTVKPGMRDELMKIAKENVRQTRLEKGNVEYAHFPSMENDQDMFVFEAWESYEDVAAHISAPHYLDFSAKRKPMMVEGSYRYVVYDAQEKERGDAIATWK